MWVKRLIFWIVRQIIRYCLFSALCCGWVLAQEQGSAKSDSSPLGPSIDKALFYDADIIGFDRKNQKSLFEGDVVIIGAGTIISADEVSLDQSRKILEASGHVVTLSGRNVFIGTKLTYFWETTDLKIDDAIFVTSDPNKAKKITDRVLGFTPEEVFFEARRNSRLSYIDGKKQKLKRDHADSPNAAGLPSDDIINSYAMLLEQEELSQQIPNPALAKLSAKRREDFKERRKFWSESQSFSVGTFSSPGYFKIEGDHLQRTDGNDFRALNADWTPCFCEDDESPAWGFHAERIDAQSGGYIDFTDAVLKIKDIPVLYLPRLKIPLKSERQSGFLPPTLITGDSKLGTVYTQPVFFAFKDDLDSTITTDFFQEKGTRIGVEARYEIRKYSGFSLNIETMRDKKWINDRSVRSRLQEYHQTTLEPGWCENERGSPEDLERCLENNLPIPGNTWRGSQEWSGQIFLTPRVSLITEGQLRSDHRYVEDLQLVDAFENAFAANSMGNAFNQSEGQVSYSGDEFGGSILTTYGDNVLVADDRFTGLQITGQVDLESRYHNLDPWQLLPFPLYGNLKFNSIPITENKGSRQIAAEKYSGTSLPTLGSGLWQRSMFDVVAPLKTDGIYTIDFFGNVETRAIRQSGEGDSSNRIHSYLSGLTFNVPLDGMMSFGSTDDGESRYLHHKMDWSLTFSARPSVVRRGNYGDAKSNKGAPLVYFASDRKVLNPADYSGAGVDSMIPHRRVTLSTGHRWITFKEKWSVVMGTPKDDGRESESPLSYKERAKRDFMFSGDRQITSLDDVFTETEKSGEGVDEVDDLVLDESEGESETAVWHIPRYKLVTADIMEPISFGADIAFDFEQEKLRQEAIERNRELQATGRDDEVVPYYQLPRSWIGPSFSLGINWPPYALNIAVAYDLYERVAKSIDFGLSLPTFWGVTVGLGYSLAKEAIFVQESDSLTYRNTRTSKASFSKTFFGRTSTTLNLSQRHVEGEEKPSYETQLGVSYMSQSGCWEAQFLRSKLYNEDERDASLLFQLNVVFLGHSRAANLSPGIVREYNKIR